ncbi:MAG: SurA N-terminal domain-containing protein [Rhodospirillales bacterium]
MLNALRSSAGSIAAKALLILLAFSFMAWGVTDYVGGGGVSGDVARAGESAVTPTRFLRAFDQDVRRMRAVLGPALTREDAYAMGAADQTVGRLVGEALVTEEARALGVAVADDAVRRNIERSAGFRNALGVFDRNLFNQAAANMGYGEQAFIERFRDDTASAQVLSAVAGAMTPPGAMTDAFMRRRAATRTLGFIDLPLSALPAPPEPSDAELRAYHAANEARFTAPELRRVTFVRLDPETLAESVAVSEAELAEAFESRRQQRAGPNALRLACFDSE